MSKDGMKTNMKSCFVSPEQLKEHRDWVESGGALGTRLVLVAEYDAPPPNQDDPRWAPRRNYRKAFLVNADLRQADLSWADLRGADLTGANLAGADLTGAVLWDAHLVGADLTDVAGLRPNRQGAAHPLGGADLSGATLPSDVAKFAMLDNVAALSQNAGKLFVTMITADAVMQLLISQVTDVQLLTASGTVKIPVLDADIPVVTLFWLGPLVLLILYCAFHLYLQRLWEMLAGLPALFPDGVPVTQKTYPWLLNDIVGRDFPRMQRRGQPLALSQELLFTGLAYFLVPATVFPFWARYLCRHEWTMTWWHIILTSFFLWVLLWFYFLARATLQRRDAVSGQWRVHWLPGHRVIKPGLVLLSMLPAALWGAGVWKVSQEAIDLGVPRELYQGSASDFLSRPRPDLGMDDGGRLIPRLLAELGDSPFVDFREKEVSAKPTSGADISISRTGAIERSLITSTPTPAHLKGADLRYGDLQEALLADADLRDATLSHADLRGADLFGAKVSPKTALDGADLETAVLMGADLSGADLSTANLDGADLSGADLSGADLRGGHLSGGQMMEAYSTGAHRKAVTLYGLRETIGPDVTVTNLSRANLRGADLAGADLTGADLSDADLTGAYLTGAHLNEVNLSGADLMGADLTGADLTDAAVRQAKHLTQGQLDTVRPDRVPLSLPPGRHVPSTSLDKPHP